MAAKTVLILAMTISTANAHHSFAAEYDVKKPVRLEGIVRRFEFVNPHAEIFLDVGSQCWWIETASPQALLRRGVSRFIIREPMQVIVDAYQAKDGRQRAYGRDVILADGRVFLLNPAQD